MSSPSETFELEPVPAVLAGMPTPELLRTNLHQAINLGVERMRAERGEVTQPEDTFELHRRLAGSIERLSELERVMAGGRKLMAQYQEEELVEAVGEQDGVANRALTIPDVGGDIRVAVDKKHTHEMDADQLRAAIIGALVGQDGGGFAELVTDVVNGDHAEYGPEQLESLLVELIDEAMTALIACGSYKPQVSKVRAYADHLSREGQDKLSAVVRGTIRTTVESLGVKMTRK